MTEVTQGAESDLHALAVEAFFYGFPLVLDLSEVGRFAREGIGAVPPTPYNQFGHADRLAGPETKFVSVNNDTVYSIANVDVSGAPVRLDVPDTRGRTTSFSSWTRGQTTSPTSAIGPLAPRRGRSCWSRPSGRARCRVVCA